MVKRLIRFDYITGGVDGHGVPAISIQLVPSQTSNAHAPSVAGRIAVPAEPPSRGTTLDDADITVNAWIVEITRMRPALEAAAGSVIVLGDEPRLEMMNVTPAATV
jgi:hypothetical protein